MFRVRMLDSNNDYSFGKGNANFFVDSSAAVAQAIATRFNLWQGEWFLDLSKGTPWEQSILGKVPLALRTYAIQRRILKTPFVTGITNYSETIGVNRSSTVTCNVNTQFGTLSFSLSFGMGVPSTSGYFELNVSPLSQQNPLG